ncbi:MAG: VWA domain-containing protein, partial [Acidimicrobiia bacterium]|nr:VWA domain-containing protein [Acidimicrobiia bacterium]
MTFLAPERLALLLAVAALAVLYGVVQYRRRQYVVRFTNVELLDQVAPQRPGWRRHVVAAGFLGLVTLLVLAFAEPARDVRVPRERATVVLAIDTSLSMMADDVSPSRIDAAKSAAIEFLADVPEQVNLGLVSFNGTATVRVAPTTDR